VISERDNLILRRPESRKKRQELEEKLAKAVEEKKKHSFSHT